MEGYFELLQALQVATPLVTVHSEQSVMNSEQAETTWLINNNLSPIAIGDDATWNAEVASMFGRHHITFTLPLHHNTFTLHLNFICI